MYLIFPKYHEIKKKNIPKFLFVEVSPLSLFLTSAQALIQDFLPWLHIRSIYGTHWSPTHGDSD